MSYVSYPLRLAWQNRVSMAGTTISTVASVFDVDSLPWSNLKNQIPSKVGRGNSTSVNIDFEFDQAYDVTQFILLNHNITTNATVTLQGATNSSFAPVAVSTGITVTSESLPLLWEYASAQTYQYWRISITDTSLSYIEAGHAFLGTYDQLDLPNFATNLYLVDPSTKRKSYGGSTTVFQKSHYRIAEVLTSPLQQTDRRLLETIYAQVGQSKGVYVFLDPQNQRDSENPSTGLDGLHRFTIFGLFSRDVQLRHLASDWHEVESFAIEELI